MWRKTENSNADKPLEIDKNSSETVVYIRRNFVEVEETEERPHHWEYEELEIPVNSYEAYSNISDLQDAVVELASMIVG